MADGSVVARRPLMVADLFCGAGGSSTGALRAIKALGRATTLVAVNHWQVAIDTHTRNHPWARHHCTDLEHAKPRELVPEGRLDLLIASPTCTFHSRARGGRPVNDQQRMDPWHVVRWCTDLRVARIMVENVPEFMDWGPCSLVTGRPIKSRRGEYFRAWCEALRSIGYRIDFKVLCAADYGDPTTRQRFFLIGTSDRAPLRWPEPTHTRNGSTDLLGVRARWRAAAEIIDWTLPGRSIFGRKKPLQPNTIRRILAGAVRYGWPQPYLDALQALLDGREPRLDVSADEAAPFLLHFRGTSADALQRTARATSAPLPTLTAGGGHVGLVMATGAGGVARPLDQPIPTVTSGGDGGARPHLITPLLMGGQSSATAKPTDLPTPTATTVARQQLIEPIIVHRCNSEGGRNARTLDEPAPTVCTSGAGYLATPLIAPYYGGGSGQTSKPASEPLDTVSTKARFGVASPVLIRACHGDDGHTVAGRVVDPLEPLPTVTTSNQIGLAEPFLVPNFGERPGQEPRSHDVGEPLPTVAATGHIQLAQPALVAEPPAYRIDILYRMLHWRELARAMSFDDEGEVYDFAGNATEITKQIGNAVPGRLAKALVHALMEAST